MDDLEFKQLFELPRDEARDILEAFLIAGERRMPEWSAGVGFPMDYSERSVSALFHHALAEIGRERGPGELAEYDYPRFASVWLTRVAYYFGQALIRRTPQLRWDLGSPKTAYMNHPVIAGFHHGAEASMVMITKTILFSVLSGVSSPDRIDMGVSTWFSARPQKSNQT